MNSDSSPATLSRSVLGERSALIILLAVLLLAGLSFANDYGMSWDEPDNAAYGEQALNTYLTLHPPVEWQSNLETKGPFYGAIAAVISMALSRVIPGWSQIEARHFAFFLSLPIAATALYHLARRWVRPAAAFGAVLLFVTQPMFWGHAFINPKDTPFMAFFILSVYAGFKMVDRLKEISFSNEAFRWSERFLPVLLPGIVLGCASSIRLFAPFAALLVALYGFASLRKEFFLPFMGYGGIALLAMYITWPYLWLNPITNLLDSLRFMMDFPWTNIVLYRGLQYPQLELPWHYLPFITVIQLTEPVLIFWVFGAIVAAFQLIKSPSKLVGYGILLVWMGVPYGLAVLLDTTVYDNSRQFMFALPPIFLACAVGMEAVFQKLPEIRIRVPLAAVVLVPGLFWLIRLHPYQYVYYNSLVGGVRGAFREYELDYWATSFREAMEIVNEIAPPDTTVAVKGPKRSAAAYARPDIVVISDGNPVPEGANGPTYFIASTRSNFDELVFSDAELFEEIEIEEVPLSVILRR